MFDSLKVFGWLLLWGPVEIKISLKRHGWICMICSQWLKKLYFFLSQKLRIKKGHFLLPLTQLINILYKILKQHFSIELFLGEKKIVKSIRKCIFCYKVFLLPQNRQWTCVLFFWSCWCYWWSSPSRWGDNDKLFCLWSVSPTCV